MKFDAQAKSPISSCVNIYRQMHSMTRCIHHLYTQLAVFYKHVDEGHYCLNLQMVTCIHIWLGRHETPFLCHLLKLYKVTILYHILLLHHCKGNCVFSYCTVLDYLPLKHQTQLGLLPCLDLMFKLRKSREDMEGKVHCVIPWQWAYVLHIHQK